MRQPSLSNYWFIIDADVTPLMDAAGIHTSYLESRAGTWCCCGAGGVTPSPEYKNAVFPRHFLVIVLGNAVMENQAKVLPYDKPFNTNWLLRAIKTAGLQQFSLVKFRREVVGITSLNHPEYLRTKADPQVAARLVWALTGTSILKMAKADGSLKWGDLLRAQCDAKPDDAHPPGTNIQLMCCERKGVANAFGEVGRADYLYPMRNYETLLYLGAKDEA